MSIPDHLIEEVRRRADIVEIVAEHTRLKRSGRTFRGPCPLHGGQGPNFSVDPVRGAFKCFVCGEGGDVFSFPMKHLGMSFLDAVRTIAERVGVELPDPSQQRPAEDPNAPFYEANAFAAEWFRKQLWDERQGRTAREYLERRGITREAAERFGLGWAPESWAAFSDAARTHGIKPELLLALGLIKESSKGREPYDAFRARLIFPIEDIGGRVVAFGGRLIADAGAGAATTEGGQRQAPKYLNSPETPIYHKGDLLYGLGWSRGAIRKAETALLVEGYMDYVALATHGVTNVVAALGTALTAQQAELMVRYAKRAVLLYDSDAAGLKATFRSGDELLRAGAEVAVATLPDDEDPDSLVRKHGSGALQRYVDDAVDIFERKIQILERRGYFDSVAERRRAIDGLLPTVRATADEVLRDLYLTRISEKTGVPRETLQREAEAQASREARVEPSGSAAPARRPTATPRESGRRTPDRFDHLGPERELLLVLLRDESRVEPSAREVEAGHFRNAIYREIYEELLHAHADAEPIDVWRERLSPPALQTVEELSGDAAIAELLSPELAWRDSLQQLLARPFEERLAEIQAELRQNPAEERAVELRDEQIRIRQTMRERGLPVKSGLIRGQGWAAS
jgi:DNA primase